MSKNGEQGLVKSHGGPLGASNPAFTTSQSLPSLRRAAPEPHDGDVFRFSYSEAARDRARSGLGHGDLNWCFDGQLVYRNGLLMDSYWGLQRTGSDGRNFSVEEARASGSLTFVCNLNDVETISEREYPLYADGDAFDLSYQHSCYKKFVKRRGARKDTGRMRAAVHQKVQRAKDAVDSALRSLELAVADRERLLPRIEAGEEPNL